MRENKCSSTKNLYSIGSYELHSVDIDRDYTRDSVEPVKAYAAHRSKKMPLLFMSCWPSKFVACVQERTVVMVKTCQSKVGPIHQANLDERKKLQQATTLDLLSASSLSSSAPERQLPLRTNPIESRWGTRTCGLILILRPTVPVLARWRPLFYKTEDMVDVNLKSIRNSSRMSNKEEVAGARHARQVGLSGT
ncbi:hypothetical protein IFM89_020903, partial [Coptis chinensis]